MSDLAERDRRCTFPSDRIGPDWVHDPATFQESAALNSLSDALVDAGAPLRQVVINLRVRCEHEPSSPGREWTRLLSRLKGSLNRSGALAPTTPHPPTIPFQVAVTPFVVDFESRLAQHEIWRSLPSLVCEQITNTLAAQLSRIASMTLYCELRDSLNKKSIDAASFREFNSGLLAGGWIDLCHKYPVLLRLLTNKADAYENAVCECLERLTRDRDVLAANELVSDDAVLTEFRFGQGDTHNEGRSVVRLVFSNGEELFYKPKPLANDRWFFDELGLTLRALEVPIGKLRIIDRQDYGWVQSVASLPRTHDGRVSEKGMGRLLAVAWLLNVTDLHYENLLVRNGQFFPIDLETILSVSPIFEEDSGSEWRRWSVLSTDMLRARFGSEGAKTDISGFFAEGFSSPFPYYSFANDADGIARLHIAKPTDPAATQSNEHAGPATDRPAIGSMANAFENAAIELRKPLLTHLKSAPKSLTSRLVIRPTLFYERLLQRVLMPRFLRDATEFSIELHRLHSGLSNLERTQRQAVQGIIGSEITQLQRGDIPYFSYSPHSSQIFADGEPIAGASLPENGLSMALGKVQHFDRGDVAEQVRLIDASTSLASYQWDEKNRRKRRSEIGVVHSSDPAAVKAKIGPFCQTISLAILDAYLRLPNGRTRWIGHTGDAAGKSLIPLVTDDSYFGGYWGIVVFLERAARKGRSAGLPVTQLTKFLEDEAALRSAGVGYNPAAQSVLGIDGAAGELLAVSRLLDENADRWGFLKAKGNQILKTLPERLDRKHDVSDYVAGEAGLVLSLLRFHSQTEHSNSAIATLLEKATARLLKSGRHCVATGGIYWPSPLGTNGLLGFAHGNAGYLAAMAQVISACEDGEVSLPQHHLEQCYKAIDKGLHFEYQSRRERLWPDLRDNLPRGTSCNLSWCHGLAGIGLSKLAILQTNGFCSDQKLVEDIREIAGSILRQEGGSVFDTACCGAGGEWIFLARCAEVLGDDKLVPWETVAKAMQRIQQGCGFRGFMGQTTQFGLSPSLFQGAAGVADSIMAMDEAAKTDLYGLVFKAPSGPDQADALKQRSLHEIHA